MSEADGIKSVRFVECSPGLNLGAEPKRKRKRAYHRALARGDCWAVIAAANRKMCEEMNRKLFSNIIVDPNVLPGHAYFIPRFSDILKDKK